MSNFTSGFRSAPGSQHNQCTSAVQLKLRGRHRLVLWWVNMASPSHASVFLFCTFLRREAVGRECLAVFLLCGRTLFAAVPLLLLVSEWSVAQRHPPHSHLQEDITSGVAGDGGGGSQSAWVPCSTLSGQFGTWF